MAAPVVTRSSTLMCPHGGLVQVPAAGVRVRVSEALVLPITGQGLVTGCTSSNPCVKVQFVTGTVRAKAEGKPLVTATSVGHCLAANGVLNGPVVVAGVDPRVQAS
jgi:hypothetical protein